ncbi:rhodanese-like domain-containing protein [Ruegeria sp. 6PALISEP08]|uniref:rhodanese-like domain-containing protein n=1 Tax=Ruegeria sp. 6PALISEP08 TaxID=1225660 RepID=UPI00067E964F|nr:rhodanese-like domain-containing protein [Ruegeria sp. 6PALISEP08]
MTEQVNRTRRWVLIGGGVALAAGFAIREIRLIPEDHGGERISVETAHEQARKGRILLVDIRTPREWRASGIGEGAAPLDMRREDFVEALQQLTGGQLDAPVALICARGVRSARLSNQLIAAGFTQIIDVPEGMLGSAAGPGWVRAGLPVRKFNEDAG